MLSGRLDELNKENISVKGSKFELKNQQIITKENFEIISNKSKPDFQLFKLQMNEKSLKETDVRNSINSKESDAIIQTAKKLHPSEST